MRLAFRWVLVCMEDFGDPLRPKLTGVLAVVLMHSGHCRC